MMRLLLSKAAKPAGEIARITVTTVASSLVGAGFFSIGQASLATASQAYNKLKNDPPKPDAPTRLEQSYTNNSI